jgi:F0F1-type ATP synthase epsilon subunit
MPNSPALTVVIKNKDKTLFEGQAYAISSINDKGPFDILPQHENFITLIKNNIIVHTTPKEKVEIQIENGLARVSENKVDMFVNFKY